MKTKLLLPILGALAVSQSGSPLIAGDSEPLPVLMVIANQDFYYREYSDTRRSLEASGLDVVVAATTTERSLPTPDSGQSDRSGGMILPDLALTDVEAGDYSAIVFVGGWGSSMYQYAYSDPNFDGTIDSYYADHFYDGEGNLGKGKIVVNDLINEFVERDKHVAAICHGVTVLAWARVDGESVLHGKKVAASVNGSPATYYLDRWYADNELSVYEQVVDNGGFANPYSGEYGDPSTAADDVIVDGRIITAENYDSAFLFGRVIAIQILKSRN